jgi:transposase
MSRSKPSRKRSPRKSKTPKPYLLGKPQGLLHTRVQSVGPEHFGVLCVDCGKRGSKYMLANFYGQPLLVPTKVSHMHGAMQAALDHIDQALKQHDLKDFAVAIERTGEYHRPIQRACRERHWDTRLVHPFATKQYRQPADPNNKTDDTDLAAIFHVALNGFGLVEPVWPDEYLHLQLLRRHRRDLVQKTTQLQCQIKEKLHAAMPGYADAVSKDHFWDSSLGMYVARHTGSPQAVRQLGFDGLTRLLHDAKIRSTKDTLYKILAWANDAPPAHPHSAILQTILAGLDDDRLEKTKQISAVERQLAHLVVRTPYVLLLLLPGINIVSSAELAGEQGPINLYAHPNNITGRAGLMPCRYQSEGVDVQGSLRRAGNLKLRAVLLQIADNLVRHNDYYRARAARWSTAGKDPRAVRIKVNKCFTRFAFALLTSRQLFRHPACQERHYILGKILKFHTEHGTPTELFRQDMEAACAQLPKGCLAGEKKDLKEHLADLARKRGPQPLADVISIVLARVKLRQVESTVVRAEDPHTHA